MTHTNSQNTATGTLGKRHTSIADLKADTRDTNSDTNSLKQDSEWDIIIAGGGITGAGIAREAARRGLKVLLVERKDFAWGTSSRSSKMVHGGLRYIAAGDIKTTMHSVRERERLLEEAPGLVDKMAYVMAHYKGVFPPPFLFNILLRIYDFFAGKRYRIYHKKPAFQKLSPHIKEAGLIGGTEFADAVTDDSRLVMRVLHEAKKDGATIINYVAVSALLKDETGQVIGATLTDTDTGEQFTAHAKAVVSATGAWADELRQAATPHTAKPKVRPSRGSHLVIAHDKLPIDHAYTLMHPTDKRALFIFPWETRTVIGTTDLDHPNLGNDEVGITQDELDYLLVAGKNLFPDAHITVDDVICTWAGVRPLISSAEDGKKVAPSKEKRDHSIWNDSGLITVSGGKLTTFRLIALDVLEAAEQQLGMRIHDDKSAMFTPAIAAHPEFRQLDADSQQRILGHYGMAADTLLEMAQAGELARIPETNTLWAELRYAAAHEQVKHLDDLLLRRTRLGLLLEKGGLNHAERIKRICQETLGWDDAVWQAEIKRYTDIWQRYYYLPAHSSSQHPA